MSLPKWFGTKPNPPLGGTSNSSSLSSLSSSIASDPFFKRRIRIRACTVQITSIPVTSTANDKHHDTRLVAANDSPPIRQVEPSPPSTTSADAKKYSLHSSPSQSSFVSVVFHIPDSLSDCGSIELVKDGQSVLLLPLCASHDKTTTSSRGVPDGGGGCGVLHFADDSHGQQSAAGNDPRFRFTVVYQQMEQRVEYNVVLTAFNGNDKVAIMQQLRNLVSVREAIARGIALQQLALAAVDDGSARLLWGNHDDVKPSLSFMPGDVKPLCVDAVGDSPPVSFVHKPTVAEQPQLEEVSSEDEFVEAAEFQGTLSKEASTSPPQHYMGMRITDFFDCAPEVDDVFPTDPKHDKGNLREYLAKSESPVRRLDCNSNADTPIPLHLRLGNVGNGSSSMFHVPMVTSFGQDALRTSKMLHAFRSPSFRISEPVLGNGKSSPRGDTLWHNAQTEPVASNENPILSFGRQVHDGTTAMSQQQRRVSLLETLQCRWCGRLVSSLDHEKKCSMRVQVCSECGVEMEASSMFTHMKGECRPDSRARRYVGSEALLRAKMALNLRKYLNDRYNELDVTEHPHEAAVFQQLSNPQEAMPTHGSSMTAFKSPESLSPPPAVTDAGEAKRHTSVDTTDTNISSFQSMKSSCNTKSPAVSDHSLAERVAAWGRSVDPVPQVLSQFALAASRPTTRPTVQQQMTTTVPQSPSRTPSILSAVAPLPPSSYPTVAPLPPSNYSAVALTAAADSFADSLHFRSPRSDPTHQPTGILKSSDRKTVTGSSSRGVLSPEVKALVSPKHVGLLSFAPLDVGGGGLRQRDEPALKSPRPEVRFHWSTTDDGAPSQMPLRLSTTFATLTGGGGMQRFIPHDSVKLPLAFSNGALRARHERDSPNGGERVENSTNDPAIPRRHRSDRDPPPKRNSSATATFRDDDLSEVSDVPSLPNDLKGGEHRSVLRRNVSATRRDASRRASPRGTAISAGCTWCGAVGLHLDKRCPSRRLRCKRCGAHTLLAEKETHRATCPGAAKRRGRKSS